MIARGPRRRRYSRLILLLIILGSAIIYHRRSLLAEEKNSNLHNSLSVARRKFMKAGLLARTKSSPNTDLGWSQAFISLHRHAGRKCSIRWAKEGQSCSASSYIAPPLDLVWLWQNESDTAYVHAKSKYASTAQMLEAPVMDTLRFSLRSGQRHLGPGFGNVVIVAPDLAEVAEGSSHLGDSSSSERQKLIYSFKLLKQLRNLLTDGSKAVINTRQNQEANEPTQDPNTSPGKASNFGERHLFFDEVNNLRQAQRPSWLEYESKNPSIKTTSIWQLACQAHLENHPIEEEQSSSSSIKVKGLVTRRLHPFLKRWGRGKQTGDSEANLWTLVASYACKQRSLPTFNPSVMRSVATEYDSQSGAFILLEKHHFFGNKVDSSHFFSPLYGPIFRLSDTGVGYGDDAIANATSARHLSQINANTLLGSRFGHRDRAGLLDLPTIIVKDLLHETGSVWRKELLQSQLQRISAKSDIDLTYLYIHYTIERHREALLWSFFVAKHDVNGDNKYSSKEMIRLLSDLGLTTETIPRKAKSSPILFPIRPRAMSPQEYQRKHTAAGIIKPAIDEVTFTSQHGYLGVRDSWGEANLKPAESDQHLEAESDADYSGTLQKERLKDDESKNHRIACHFESVCFAPLFDESAKGVVRATDLFEHMAFKHWGCGDCVMRHLLNKAGPSAFDVFLPSPDLHFPAVQTWSSGGLKTHLSAKSHFEVIDYSLDGVAQEANQAAKSRLEFVAGMLVRYSYAIANTVESQAIGIFNDENPEKSAMLELEKAESTIFSLTNLSNKKRRRIDQIIHAWLSMQLGEPIEVERKGV